MDFQSQLNYLLSEWRIDYPEKKFPQFDPRIEDPPHTLILLESPGPQVMNSGIVQVSNQDETAKELRRLLDIGFETPDQTGVLCWNAVPWYLSRKPNKSDINSARPLHSQLLKVLCPSLQFVVLLGEHARSLLPFFSPIVANAYIYGGHHPGKQAQIQNGLVEENEKLFSMLRIRTKSTKTSQEADPK